MNKAFIKSWFLLVVMLMGLSATAQTQQGYVKTKGRMVNGQLVPGQGLKGAIVSIKGRTAVLVNADDGTFSFPVSEQQFRVDSVKKKGYQLVDMDACPKTYNYSSNPLYIVMETPEQQLQDKLTAERKIRRNLQMQLQEREDEIEALKEQQKITEEEYRQALQKLYQDQESNEQLISDMAKRYSELDYDQLDEFYRQVSYCIENGELVKADSLLRTRGDITVQVGDILHRGQIIQQEKEQIHKAEAVQQADIEEAARRCYSYYETFAAQHLNDTAAYYLELRASLDTTNVDWQNEAGEFFRDYIADYKKSLSLYFRALRQSVIQNGETSEDVAKIYKDIGSIYDDIGAYDLALESIQKSLTIREILRDSHSLSTAHCYEIIGSVFHATGMYDMALENYNKELLILSNIFGENDKQLISCFNNIGTIYSSQGERYKGLEYYEKALALAKTHYGEEHQNTADIINNIGVEYQAIGDNDKALQCFARALSIYKTIFGEKHPSVATSYYNIGYVNMYLGNLNESIDNIEKAIIIWITVFGEINNNTADGYDGLGRVYYKLEEYDKAIAYYNKAMAILKTCFGDRHPKIAILYINIGNAYNKLGMFEQALMNYEEALPIRQSIFGEDHPYTMKTKEKISEIQIKMKEQGNE